MNLGQENEMQEFKLSLAQLDKGLKSLSAMVTLPFGFETDQVKVRQMKESIQNLLSNNQKKVVDFLLENPDTTLQEAANETNLSLGGVKKIVGKLQKMKIIERQGARNKSIWHVLL